ncbi:hypothetical protein ACFE04_015894 [Oxalis oulophora]
MENFVTLALLIFILQASTNLHFPLAYPTTNPNIEYIKTSCNVTLYQTLCFNSLSIYASKIEPNPKSVAETALNVTLSATQRTSNMMKKLTRTHFLRAKEAKVMADCMEVLGDSVDELTQSIKEMDGIAKANFGMTMSDIETWVSAVLTDEDTCMDGFDDEMINGDLKSLVRKYIVKVAHMTSNALALVNKYASSNN